MRLPTFSTVHIWYYLLNDQDKLENLDLDLLNYKEKKRLELMGSLKRKIQFAFGRIILKTLLNQYLNQPISELQLLENNSKKLCLAFHQDLQFNYSHSHRMIVLGFSWQRSIGIDVEYKKPMRAFERIIERFFSKHELHQFNQLSRLAQTDFFFKAWTRKESLVKGSGGKLLPILRTEGINSNSYNKLLKLLPNKQYADWQIYDLSILFNYQVAFALEKKQPVNISIRPFYFTNTNEKLQ